MSIYSKDLQKSLNELYADVKLPKPQISMDDWIKNGSGTGTVWGGLTDDDWNYKPPTCECGADKTYGANNQHHSDWCPLAKESKNGGR